MLEKTMNFIVSLKSKIIALLIVMGIIILFISYIFVLNESIKEENFAFNMTHVYDELKQSCQTSKTCLASSIEDSVNLFNSLESLKFSGECSIYLDNLNEVVSSIIYLNKKHDLKMSISDKVNVYGYHIWGINHCFSQEENNIAVINSNLKTSTYLRKEIGAVNILSFKNYHTVNRLDILNKLVTLK